MLRFDSQGWLIPSSEPGMKVELYSTTKTSSLAESVNGRPLAVVWHWAAGGYGREEDTSPNVTAYMIKDKDDLSHRASWHFFINKRGEIYQFVPLNRASWTTGSGGKLWDRNAIGLPVWRDFSDVNRATIGVELENAGVLLKRGDTFYAWPYGSGAAGLSEVQARKAAEEGKIQFQSQYAVDPRRAVRFSDGNYYDRWPPAQVRAVEALSRALAQALDWKDPERIHYGHRTFYTKRDPGLLFMEGVLPEVERRIWGKGAGGRAMPSSAPGLFLVLAAGFGFWFWKRRRSGT